MLSTLQVVSLCLIINFSLAASDFYSIWPKFNLDGMNADGSDNRAITEELKQDLNHDDTKLYVSRTEALSSTWYWFAELTAELVTKYQQHAGIQVVIKPDNQAGVFRALNSTRRQVERSDFVLDRDAPDQLRAISFKVGPGSSLGQAEGYKYDAKAGDGVNIYVIDSGLAKTSPEFKDRKVDWIFAGPFASQDMTDADIGKDGAKPNEEGHGTCMASVAMGNKDGVARKASLTVVRSDIYSSTLNQKSSVEIWIDAMAKVYDDVITNKLKGKAVLSISVGVDPPDTEEGDPRGTYHACFQEAMTKILNALDQQDVPVVVSPGDDQVEIRAYPAKLIKPLKDGSVPVPNMIVVGGYIINDGTFYNDIRDQEIKVYAPADDMSKGTLTNPGLECASRDGQGYHKGERGTSHATASAAGLVAYFLSQGNTPNQARDALVRTAYQRIKNGPKVVWNEVDGSPGT